MADTSQLPPSEEGGILERPDALAALAQAAFARAKKHALEELERHGVPIYGADNEGRIVVRQPKAVKASMIECGRQD